MAFFAVYPSSNTIPKDTNVLFSEVLINNGDGYVFVYMYFASVTSGKGFIVPVLYFFRKCMNYLLTLLITCLSCRFGFADMTQALGYSLFPLVEMGCTTSALICWCGRVNMAISTSEWMEWFCALLGEMQLAIQIWIHRWHAVVLLNLQKVNKQETD